MISLESIRGFFPEELRSGQFSKHILKEYVEYLALEWISRSRWAPKLVFIGGTSLRLINGIDRFSEALDFDCKGLSPDEFVLFTDALVAYLKNNGLDAVAKDKESGRLAAMRRSILFPGLLREMGLSAFKEERFMMKIEAQDQGREYAKENADIRRCGFFFPIRVPGEATLCAMKISALLARGKGRDFYDTMFLLQRTEPDYTFFNKSYPKIVNIKSLKAALKAKAKSVDLELKRRDVEHLLFRQESAELVKRFPSFVDSL